MSSITDWDFIKKEVSDCSKDDTYAMYAGWGLFAILLGIYLYSGFFSGEFDTSNAWSFVGVTTLGTLLGIGLTATVKLLTCKYVYEKNKYKSRYINQTYQIR